MLEYIEGRIRKVIHDRQPTFWVDAGELSMAYSSLFSAEFFKRPDSDPPLMHRGEGGLPNYGKPDDIAMRMAESYRRNHAVTYDPGEMLALALGVNGNNFFRAICGCYNACRNFAAIERGLTDFGEGPIRDAVRVAEKALANIRPPGDPNHGDKGGPNYHFWGIGVAVMSYGDDATGFGAGVQQFIPNTNRSDHFKHHDVGVFAVSLFYHLRRENDPVYNAAQAVQDVFSPVRWVFSK